MANIPVYSNSNNMDYYNVNLNQALQDSVSNNGFVVPTQSTQDIETLSEEPTDGARILLDSETSELKVIINGVIKTFTLT